MFLSLIFSLCFGLNFEQAFQIAKEKNLDFAISQVNQKKAVANQSQAKASLFPKLSVTSSSDWTDTGDANAVLFERDGHSHTAAASISQTLFKGGENYHLYKFANLLPKAADLQNLSDSVQLYSNLAERFYQVLYLEDLFKIKQEEVSLLEDRLKVLRRRVSIGQSRRIDVLNAESQLAQTKSQIASIESSYYTAKIQLKNILGLSDLPALQSSRTALDLQLNTIARKPLESLSVYRLEKTKLEISEREYKASKGSFYPSITAGANYYFDRPSVSRDIKWDANITASWELFSGKSDLANLRIKSYDKQVQELRVIDTKRRLALDFDQTYELFALRKKELISLNETTDLSQKVYLRNSRDYKKGLVSNLDVLDSLKLYLGNKAQAKELEYSLIQIFHRAKALSEDIP